MRREGRAGRSDMGLLPFCIHNFVNLKQKEVSYIASLSRPAQAGCAEAFIDAIQVNAAASGPPSPAAWCSTFRDRQDPDLVYLYEVHRDDAAYEAHNPHRAFPRQSAVGRAADPRTGSLRSDALECPIRCVEKGSVAAGDVQHADLVRARVVPMHVEVPQA